MSKNKELIISLSLSLGIILSLLIATPNAYWQRYEFAIYYLIPVFIYILIYGLKGVDINDK